MWQMMFERAHMSAFDVSVVPILLCGIAATFQISMYSTCFEINLSNSYFYSWHQCWTLNASHVGQALATALTSNNTVVDINLANNFCCDEGAEAYSYEPI